MNTFYQLAPEQQAQHLTNLAATATCQWGLEGAKLELLKHRENAVFAVTSSQGEKFALRVHRADYHSDAEINSELQWMQALNEYGVHTPQVIPAMDGALFQQVADPGVPETRQCDLLSWIEGTPIGTVEAGLHGDEGELVSNYRTVGRLAAQLHNQSANWQPPAGFTRHHWDVDGLVGENPFWGRFWELQLLTAEQRQLIQTARAKVRQQLLAFGNGPDRYGLIHADFVPDNLMTSNGEVTLIDFDDAGFGWHLFEFATSLFFQIGEPDFEALLQAMIDGYREERDLPDEHLEYLPTFFLARGFANLAWLHTRSETDVARELGPSIVQSVCELAKNYLEETNLNE